MESGRRKLLLLPALGAALALLGGAVVPTGPARAQSPQLHSHRHRFRDAERWARVFDDPARDAWQKPDEVIGALGLEADDVVADIGSGTGYFAARLAAAVPKGRVYGVDLEPDMVDYLAERARREQLPNLVAIQGSADDPRLPDPVDLILLVDTYHHIEDRERYFRKLLPSLAPGGRVAIIDFRMESPVGPPRSARIEPQRVIDELRAAGFRAVQSHDFLPHQYFLVFQPAS